MVTNEAAVATMFKRNDECRPYVGSKLKTTGMKIGGNGFINYSYDSSLPQQSSYLPEHAEDEFVLSSWSRRSDCDRSHRWDGSRILLRSYVRFSTDSLIELVDRASSYSKHDLRSGLECV